jgi:hypothetical protein
LRLLMLYWLLCSMLLIVFNSVSLASFVIR